MIDALHAAIAGAVARGDDPRLAVERALRAQRVPLRAPHVGRADGGRAYRWDVPGGPVLLVVRPGRAPEIRVGSALPLTPSEDLLMRHRMNPTAFHALQREVASKASESAQINAVVAALAALGYAGAASPEVSQTSVDRSTYRIYLWRDSPFDDHLVLATGPSFEPTLLLGASIPKAPTGPGFYIHALIAEGKVKALAGADRAATRTARAASQAQASSAAAAKAKAETARHKAEAKAAKEAAEREIAARKDADMRAERERADRADAERRTAEARAETERAKREAAEKKAGTRTLTGKSVKQSAADKAAAEKAELAASLAALLG